MRNCINMTNSMKRLIRITAGLLLASGSVTLCPAWQTGGYVFCDANQDGQIDSGDTPVPSVLVVVTNTSGTYSNATYTDTPDGGFVMDLPSVPDSYVEYLNPLSLPSDATVAVPSGGSYMFSLDGVTTSNFLGNFLFISASCAGSSPPPPPPPPPVTNGCCLAAHGQVCEWNSKAHYDFEAEVIPDCSSTNGDDSGHWDVVSRELNLKFDSCVFQTISCGELLDTNTGCISSFIEVQGAGTLRTEGYCKGRNRGHPGGSSTLVLFDALAEDHGNCETNDALYFRAYDTDGTTELLISTDMTNATDVAPVPIKKGDIDIGTSCCTQGEGNEGGHGHHGPPPPPPPPPPGNGEGEGHGHHGHGPGEGQGGQGQNSNCTSQGQGNQHGHGHRHGGD